ncbi:hypothetical protein B0H19DRAFT_1123854 [Mycena capillaripes]|nr:hypothetical protein B0H19DRAFT_1203856 [Mycena capillaripes]KAJ6574164.1 hypothetical protein B0H19DRAFT_1123854 [Mycena capillaripes]
MKSRRAWPCDGVNLLRWMRWARGGASGVLRFSVVRPCWACVTFWLCGWARGSRRGESRWRCRNGDLGSSVAGRWGT